MRYNVTESSGRCQGRDLETADCPVVARPHLVSCGEATRVVDPRILWIGDGSS
jgi:hypothetical protein